MENKIKSGQEVISQQMIDLVIARLEAMPQNLLFSIGNEGDFNVSDLIDRVRSQDDIGKKIIEMQLAYLRSLGNLPIDQNAMPFLIASNEVAIALLKGNTPKEAHERGRKAHLKEIEELLNSKSYKTYLIPFLQWNLINQVCYD